MEKVLDKAPVLALIKNDMPSDVIEKIMSFHGNVAIGDFPMDLYLEYVWM